MECNRERAEAPVAAHQEYLKISIVEKENRLILGHSSVAVDYAASSNV